MVTTKIGTHTVEYYDTIDELPVVRFHKYQKYLLVDAGVGADIDSFDRRIEKARRFIMAGKGDKAQQELENLRQCVFLLQNELTPKHLAFAVLVTRIDGQECNDLSDEALRGVLDRLAETPYSKLTAHLEAVKKKIDDELVLYFPTLFDNSSVKEYFDLLRQRTLAVLKGITEGVVDPEGTEEAERLTTALVTYSNPQTFSGSGGVEVQFDRNFENLCLALSEQLNVRPKEYTVLEFYNAFDFVQERAKATERAKRPR